MSRKLFGCIADDFTGGSDAASFLVAGGMNTVLCNGIPREDFFLPEECEAVVIALKSRTQNTKDAVADSLAAIRWLARQGAEQFYIKYCSTFDSTSEGNIGPIVDAVLEETNTPGTILCPALPANGRVVKGGILYVKGVPLAESPMKDHPLTPMRKSRIAQLMAPQGKYPSYELHQNLLHGGRTKLEAEMAAFSRNKTHYYLIPDYVDDADAEVLADIFGDYRVLTGGSGILTALARRLKKDNSTHLPQSATSGSALILAGSCSTATNAQTAWFRAQGGVSIRLEDAKVLDGTQTADILWNEVRTHNEPVLVYSYETPEGLQAKRNEEGRRLSALIEQTLSGLAAKAAAEGVTRIIVAGGETSGAVTKKLGYEAFQIGESIAPGVPILLPLDAPAVRLVLKSGNFGQEDFFGRALAMTGKEA